MKPVSVRRRVPAVRALAALCILAGPARAVTTVFFDASQTTNLVSSGTTSDTISSEGYLFTYTRDKLLTGGISTNPPGRYLRVLWPEGLEVQAVTEGPFAPVGPKLTIKRIDGELFDISSFTAKLLANTGGAGGAIEIMPLLNGKDGVLDPYMYNVSGSAGQSFFFITPELTGYDEYKITLYVDFAMTTFIAVDASLPPPPDPVMAIAQLGGGIIEVSWPSDADGFALETSTNLPAQTWSPVTNDVVLNGDLFTVQPETPEPHLMYRLRK